MGKGWKWQSASSSVCGGALGSVMRAGASNEASSMSIDSRPSATATCTLYSMRREGGEGKHVH